MSGLEPSEQAMSEAMSIPCYSKQEYWEQRYQTEPGGGPEWYLGWPQLKRHLCDLEGILGHLALVPPARVLELGCGNFSLVPGLASSGFAAIGVDFSPTATADASRAASGCGGCANFVTLDVRALPLRSGSIEAVVDKGCGLHTLGEVWMGGVEKYFEVATYVMIVCGCGAQHV